jgi:hypothetical protein
VLRPAIVAFVDQALLSALSFALSLALIRLAPASEYGLYTQLLNLQSLFSVVHAGIFVSGLLALHPALTGDERLALASRMARSDARFGIVGAAVVTALTFVGAAALGHPVSPGLALASALAIVGLWWREFARASQFAEMRADHVLRLDLGFSVATLLVLIALAAWQPLTAGTVLLATGIAGAAVGGVAVAQLAASGPADGRGPSWRQAWHHGQWDTYGSIVTWLQSQSYVYFAAAAGGLALAGAVSAARLMGMPLALAWAGSASLLRVAVANALATADRDRVRHLAQRALVVVFAVSAVYGAVVAVLLPLVDQYVYQRKFTGLGAHVAWWLLYFTLTGISTAGAAVLRGALRMAPLFRYYALACVVTVATLGASALWHLPLSLVTGLVAGEIVLCALVWSEVRGVLRRPPAAAGSASALCPGGERLHVSG